MIFKKFFKKKNEEDNKYEILYYKYSQLKLENKKLKENIQEEKIKLRDKILEKIIEMLLNLENDISEMKNLSFKINPNKDKETQQLLISINKVEKNINEILNKLNVESIIPEERFYDPEIHEVSSYSSVKNVQKGVIIKMVKKGWKYKNKILKKPKVIVSN